MRFKVSDIGLNPVHVASAFFEPFSGKPNGGCRDVEHGDLLESFIKQVIDEDRRAATDIDDRIIHMDPAILNKL